MYHAKLDAIAPYDGPARVGEDDAASDDAKARTIAYLLDPSIDFKLAPDVALTESKLRPPPASASSAAAAAAASGHGGGGGGSGGIPTTKRGGRGRGASAVMSRDEALTIGRNAIEGDVAATQRLIEGYSQLSKALDTEQRYKRDAVSSLKEATEREAQLKVDCKKLAAAAGTAKSDGIQKAKLAVTKAVAAVQTKHEKETEKAEAASESAARARSAQKQRLVDDAKNELAAVKQHASQLEAQLRMSSMVGGMGIGAMGGGMSGMSGMGMGMGMGMGGGMGVGIGMPMPMQGLVSSSGRAPANAKQRHSDSSDSSESDAKERKKKKKKKENKKRKKRSDSDGESDESDGQSDAETAALLRKLLKQQQGAGKKRSK